MGAHLRRMKSYRPRRPRAKKTPDDKAALLAIEQKLSSEIHQLMRSAEQGDISQVEALWINFRDKLETTAREMKILAEKIGGKHVQSIHTFFHGIQCLLEANPKSIDTAQIHRCYEVLRRLESELKVA